MTVILDINQKKGLDQMGEEFYPEQNRSRKIILEIYDWVEAAMVAIISVVLMFTFLVRMAGVDGDSMYPTLKDQDRLLISRVAYTPTAGDIVVITKPVHREGPLVKRIIATEGQTVSIDFDQGVVFIDGDQLDEFYVNSPTNQSYDLMFDEPVTVPEGCVFVMGDNRNNSWDSRASQLGMVDERYILGKAIYRIWPYNEMGVPN